MKLSLSPLKPALTSLTLGFSFLSMGCAVATAPGGSDDEGESDSPLQSEPTFQATDGMTTNGTASGTDSTYQSTSDAQGASGTGTTTPQQDSADAMALSGTPATVTFHSVSVSCATVDFPDGVGLSTEQGVPGQTGMPSGATFEATAVYSQVNQAIQLNAPLTAPADLTGCTISASISSAGGPGCGLWALPYAWNGTFLAPIGEGGWMITDEVTSTPTTVNFTLETGGAGVEAVGFNIYSCGPPAPTM